MTPSKILATLRERGVSVRLGPTGTTIRIFPASALTAYLRRAILANKPGVLELLRIGDAMYRECSFRSVNSVSANETLTGDTAARGFSSAASADARSRAPGESHLSGELPGAGQDDDVPSGTCGDVADARGADP